MPKKYILEAEQTNQYIAHVQRIKQIKNKRKQDQITNLKHQGKVLKQKHAIHSKVRLFQNQNIQRQIQWENNRLAKTLTYIKSCEQSKYNDSSIQSKFTQRKRDWINKLNLQNYHIGKRLLQATSSLTSQINGEIVSESRRLTKHLKFTTARPQFLNKKQQVCNQLIEQDSNNKVRIPYKGLQFLCFKIKKMQIQRTHLYNSPENLFCIMKRTGYCKYTPLMPLNHILSKQFIFQIPKCQLSTGNSFTFALLNDRQGTLIQICYFAIKFESNQIEDRIFCFKNQNQTGVIQAKSALKKAKQKQKKAFNYDKVLRRVRSQQLKHRNI